MQKLGPLFEAAHEQLKRGDKEEAYIMIMRYLNVVAFIQKSDDFTNHPKYYKAMMGKQPLLALNLAEELQRFLSEEYIALHEADNEKTDNERVKKTEIVILEPPDMRVKKESESTLSSAHLFSMLKDGVTKVLIIDARTALDFENSRIDESSVLNVPENIIAEGLVK